MIIYFYVLNFTVEVYLPMFKADWFAVVIREL